MKSCVAAPALPAQPHGHHLGTVRCLCRTFQHFWTGDFAFFIFLFMWQCAVSRSVLPSCRVSGSSSSFNSFFFYKSILLSQALQLGSSGLCVPQFPLLLPRAHLGPCLRKWHHKNAFFPSLLGFQSPLCGQSHKQEGFLSPQV